MINRRWSVYWRPPINAVSLGVRLLGRVEARSEQEAVEKGIDLADGIDLDLEAMPENIFVCSVE